MLYIIRTFYSRFLPPTGLNIYRTVEHFAFCFSSVLFLFYPFNTPHHYLRANERQCAPICGGVSIPNDLIGPGEEHGEEPGEDMGDMSVLIFKYINQMIVKSLAFPILPCMQSSNMYFKNILACLTLFSTGCAVAHTKPFAHPGALHTNQDIQRIKKYVKAESQPWFRAWQHLESTTLAQTTWLPKPHEILVRGTNATWQPTPAQNYGDAYRDAHSAYQLTLRWLIGGNTSYADHAVQILNGWGSTLRDINGTEDKFLAAGLYGYQFANAAELLRVYPGWSKADQTMFGDMLNDVFAKYNFEFLEHHNYKTNFYYANWDLCNIASLQAIGIFNDNQTMYEYAVHYWQYGLPDSSVVVNGALPYFSIANFTEDSGKQLMQIQASGRDQGHATLCIALLGVIGQQGWNQGVDLFSTYQNEILHA